MPEVSTEELYLLVVAASEELYLELGEEIPDIEEVAARVSIHSSQITQLFKMWQLEKEVNLCANSILAEGKYPTRNDMCDRLHKSARDIQTPFAKWKLAHPKDEIIKVQQKTVSVPPDNNSDVETSTEAPKRKMTRKQQQIEYETAAELLQKEFHTATYKFNTPGLQQDFDTALDEIQTMGVNVTPAHSPKALLEQWKSLL